MAAKLSDKELRRQSLKLKDPYDQSALIWQIPAEAGLLSILNIYAFERWPTEKVYCAKCNGRHHKFGFTALLTNGKRVLLGSKCGADVFGESWHQAERHMKGQSDRQWELDRLDRLAPIVSPMRQALLSWENKLAKAMGRKNGFCNTFTELASRLSEAANIHGGILTVTRELEMKSAQQAGMGGLGSTQNVTVKVADFIGADLFIQLDPVRAIQEAISAIEVLKKTISATDAVPTTILRKKRKALERAFEDLEIVAKLYRGAQAMFTAKSFSTLADWTSRYAVTKDRYIWEDGALQFEDGRAQIYLPTEPLPDLSDEPLDLLREYRRAD